MSYSPFDQNNPNLKNFKLPVSSVGLILAGLFVLVGLFSSFYTIQAESEGIVTRFGKYTKTVPSGLHFKIPFGIERVQPVPVKRQLKLEFGFATRGATNPNQYALDPKERPLERNMVSGDLNAATVEWVVQYRISDPISFLFKVRNPEQTFRDISESVMRSVVGDRTVDEVITIGRQEIESEAVIQMRELVERYELGLTIDPVQLKDVNPPQPVQPSFNEVNQAQQEREQLINVANGEYNKVVPRARGEAQQKIEAAQGYALKRVNEAKGDVSRFNAVLAEYVKAPEVTKRRLYLETMEAVIPQLGQKIVVDDDAKQILPLLQLNQTSTQGGK
ncbi:MAG: FtsH protease activity modulator HflK [Verrucomicrobiota bacterium]